MTATQLTYEAWKRTGHPLPYNTRDGKGNDIVVEVELLDSQTHPAYDERWSGSCTICAGQGWGGVPAKKLLGISYTDWHVHKSPESSHVCEACAWSIMMNAKRNRQTLLRYSFMASADKGLKLCNRQEMRDALINPPEPPFVAVVAVSQKKHLAIKAQVSYSRDRYCCLLEDERIYVSLEEFTQCIRIVEALRGLGCVKDEIEKAAFRFERLKEWGMENLEIAVEALTPYLRTATMRLALHVAQKNEDKEDCICCLGFKPMT